MTQHQVISRAVHLRIWELTWEEIGNILGIIVVYIVGGQDVDVDLSGEDSMPRFWANSDNDAVITDFIVLGVGVCFGAIHCIAWGFPFLTHKELLMWRVSCVAITAIPIYIPLGYFLHQENRGFS